VKAASQEKQLALIRAHPDLVGRAASKASKESPSPPTAPLSRSDSAREGGVGGEGQKSGTLTPQSSSEQATAGLDRLTADEIASFQNLNRAYRERFGFPFVICARLNKKEAILGGFEKRLKNVREQEIKTALDEIAKIAWLRLQDLIKNDK